MKTLKLFFAMLIASVSLAGTCEPEPMEEPCECHIEGTKQISFDNGETWSYNGTDERTGELFSCDFDSTYTNQTTSGNAMYRIFWECID